MKWQEMVTVHAVAVTLLVSYGLIDFGVKIYVPLRRQLKMGKPANSNRTNCYSETNP